MADEAPPAATQDGISTPAAPATQPTTPTITPEIQAIIDAEKQKAHDAGAAAARRSLEGRQKQPEPVKQATPAPSTQQTGLSIEDVRAISSADRAFDRAVGKAGLSDEAVSMLDTLRAIEKPSDIAAWVESKRSLFATAPAAAGTPAPQPTQAAKPVPPATGIVPAPVSTVPSDAPDNVLGWSEDQVANYIAKHYPVPSMPWHPKNALARRTLAQKVQAQMVGRSIALGGPRT